MNLKAAVFTTSLVLITFDLFGQAKLRYDFCRDVLAAQAMIAISKQNKEGAALLTEANRLIKNARTVYTQLKPNLTNLTAEQLASLERDLANLHTISSGGPTNNVQDTYRMLLLAEAAEKNFRVTLPKILCQ